MPPSILSALLATAGGMMIARRWREFRVTTLRAPLAWGIGSLLSLAAVELLVAGGFVADSAGHWRLIAACTTFCPLMAVLGAKRPQDRAWQFVVGSLLGVLVFYVLTELAFRPGRPPQLHYFVRWFLIVPLLLMGLLNALPTPHWPSALLAAAGQLALLAPFMPEIGWWPVPPAGDWQVAFGVTAILAAAGMWGLDLPRRSPASHPLERAWLDFRDAFGALWTLRIAARFNQTAESLDWRVALRFRGIEPSARQDQSHAESDEAIRRCFESLLRRFVDKAWIERRIQTKVPLRDGV